MIAVRDNNNDCLVKLIENDFMRALKKSTNRIAEKILDPMSVPSRKKTKNDIIKIKKQSLRGDNRFVQMAICRIEVDGRTTLLEEYAYPEDTDHTKVDVGLSASIEQIKGYGDSDKDLIAYMKNKHHSIKTDSKKAYKDFLLLDAARSPENPIYLSYTPNDLTKIGGVSQTHPFAMYYVDCEKQPIGVMSLNTINNQTINKGNNL